MNTRQDYHKPRILVIDNHTGVITSLACILPTFGYSVLTTNDGRAGVGVITRGEVDLLLLEFHMPIFSGLNVLEALNANPMTRHFPVIVMSSRVTPYVLGRSIAAGARDVISKPFDLETLQSTIAQQLQGRVV
jgi:CheY-like chemotaxis protein